MLLVNGRRISGFRELRDIPTEANERVEILPEEVALKYGYSAEDFPVAHQEYLREISLPIYSKMSEDDVESVIEAVSDIVDTCRVE